MSALLQLSPLDGRYAVKTRAIAALFSEASLMKNRLLAEIKWLEALSSCEGIPEVPTFNEATTAQLQALVDNFSMGDAITIKQYEETCNHDVKAVEYFLKDQLKSVADHSDWVEFVHFACTSEDINNIAYANMIRQGLHDVYLPRLQSLIDALAQQAQQHAHTAMLSRTHGQAATPTTLGKEIANVVFRLQQQVKQLENAPIMAKCNGAVGNFNAHRAAYPDVDWQALSETMIQRMGLQPNPYTTQIEPHDWLAALAHNLMRVNTILIDYAQDTWQYISLDYYRLQNKAHEVGSSTMPHKVNPIDFENAEGNLGLANAMWQFMANKLPISRWQRDLSDSTVMRNVGCAFGYSDLALQSLIHGVGKITANETRLQNDLDAHWEVLAEAVQTIMRKEGLVKPYEQLKAFTRGKKIDANSLYEFIQQSDLSDAAKQQCLALTPMTYLGDAEKLAKP